MRMRKLFVLIVSQARPTSAKDEKGISRLRVRNLVVTRLGQILQTSDVIVCSDHREPFTTEENCGVSFLHVVQKEFSECRMYII